MNNNNISYFRFRLNNYMLLNDECSESQRILSYRLGYNIFLKEKKSFEQYCNFLKNRHWYKFILFDCVFYLIVIATIIILGLDFFILKEIIWKDVFWFATRITILSAINFCVFSVNKNNITQTKQFLAFIDSKNKKTNFNFFRSLDLDDEMGAEFLHKQMLSDDDFEESTVAGFNYIFINDNLIKPTVEEPKHHSEDPTGKTVQVNDDQIVTGVTEEHIDINESNISQDEDDELLESTTEVVEDLPILKRKHNKTVKLLLIYFIFEEKHLNDLIDKLIFQSKTKLTKIGMYKTLAIIFGTSYINVKKFNLNGLEIIRTFKANSIEDLETVRDILMAIKLNSVAYKVDTLIEETVAYKKKEKDMKKMV